MASVAGYFNIQQFSDAGQPLAGGRIYTYTYGTTTHKNAYTDQAGLVPHTYTSDGSGGQYIPLNARGELVAPLYLAPGSYDIALKRADGSTVWTRRADPTADSATTLTDALRADIDADWLSGRMPSLKSDFGAVGDGVVDDTTAILAAIAFSNANKKAVFVPTGDYIYLGGDITDDFVCLIGEARPKCNLAMTALVGGSRFIGTMKFRGRQIILENLGVDRGAAGFATGGDALFLGYYSQTLDSHARLKNVIGLGRSPTDAYHAIGVEGYALTDIEDVVGVRTYYGLAAKVIKSNIRNVKAYENSVCGVVVRSNVPNGIVEDLVISDIVVEGLGPSGSGAGGSDYGLYIVVDDQAQRIIASNIDARNYRHAVSIRPNANVNEVIVSNVIGTNVGEGAFVVQSSTADAYSIMASNIEAIDCNAWGVYVEKAVSVQMTNVYCSSKSGSTYGDELVRIGSGVLSSVLDNVICSINRSSTSLGGIRYDNSYPHNQIGTHRANLFGVGKPRKGFGEPSVSGTTVTLTPTYDSSGVSVMKPGHSSGAITVTTIATTVKGSERFPIGHILSIFNPDLTNITISNTGTGYVVKTAGVDTVITPSRGRMFVFDGFSWVEV